MSALSIRDRRVGPGQRCFVIAEAGVNHNGDLEMARRLIDIAADASADAVKFQTFRAEALATRDAPKAAYQRETTDATESQLDMLRRLELSAADHRALVAHCAERGVLFLSSPFDESCADLLEQLDVPAFKIPSGEIINLSFLVHVARRGRPMIVSTGMSTLDEVARAVETIRGEGNEQLALLHCVSRYPADPAEVNLRAMATLAEAFGVPVGFSDHTVGNEVALAAVALGACIVEKHFTLDRSLPGPDHRASIEPPELEALVAGIRKVESSLGDGVKRPTAGEADTSAAVRKSLVAACDIPAGAALSEEMIAVRRPGTGLPLEMLGRVVGRHTRAAIAAGTPLTAEMLR